MGKRTKICKVKNCWSYSAHNTINPDLCRKHGGGYRCKIVGCKHSSLFININFRYCSKHSKNLKTCISCKNKTILLEDEIPSCEKHIELNKSKYDFNALINISSIIRELYFSNNQIIE